jgi:hypothetical protein
MIPHWMTGLSLLNEEQEHWAMMLSKARGVGNSVFIQHGQPSIWSVCQDQGFGAAREFFLGF